MSLLLENAHAVVLPRLTRRGKLVQPFLCDQEHHAVLSVVPWAMHPRGYHQSNVTPGSKSVEFLPAGRWTAHAAAWFLAGGKSAAEMRALGLSLDHADRCKLNNTVSSNLRPATLRLQQLNCGGKGYYWHVHRGKYHAAVQDAAGQSLYLGLYATEEEASAAFAPVRDAFIALEAFLSTELYYGRLAPADLQEERVRLARFQGLPFAGRRAA